MRKRFMSRLFGSERREEDIITTKHFEVDHLKQIFLITEAVDVIIQTHDEEGIDLVFTTFEDGPEMEVEQTDNGLRVDVFDPSPVRIFIFSVDLPKASLVLKVPPKIADIWEIEASSRRVIIGPIQPKAFYAKIGSGKIECPTLQAEQIDIELTSGQLTCGLLDANDLRLDVTSGRVDITHVHSKKMNIDFTSGYMHIENISSHIYEGKGTSGKITFNNVSVDDFQQRFTSGSMHVDRMHTVSMEASVTSGKMEIDRITSNAIDVRTTSGRIDLTLDEDQHDWHLELDVSSGKIEAPAEMQKTYESAKRVEGTIGEGNNQLYAKASSGKIRIN